MAIAFLTRVREFLRGLASFIKRVLVVIVATASTLNVCACNNAGNTCEELKTWYEENPGDSNIDIAKDYYRLCDEIPPPVLSGELTMDDIL